MDQYSYQNVPGGLLNDSTVQNLENMFNRAQIETAKIPRQVEVRIPPLFALFSTHSGPKKHESLEQFFCQIELKTYPNNGLVDLTIRILKKLLMRLRFEYYKISSKSNVRTQN